MHLDVAFADGEVATVSAVELSIEDDAGAAKVNVYLPLEFKTIDDPGMVTLTVADIGSQVLAIEGTLEIMWYMAGVDPADDPGLASSTLLGGDKFKGLAGGGAISYWIRWTAPNDVASLGDYTAGGNAHVLDAPGGTNILPITAVPFSIQLSYPDPL